MDDRVAEAARYGVAYPAGVVVAAVAAGLVVGVPPSGSGFAVTVVAAVVGLVALHDPQSPRRRARESVRSEEDDPDDGGSVEDPAAALVGHGPGRGTDPSPGEFDDRSRRLLVFAAGLFVLGWTSFLLSG